MSAKSLDFWFDFASTYSYPAAMRIRTVAADRGVAVRFRPFLLGPIFKSQGWDTSPFNIYPAKGRYMWRDLERICDASGLALVRPDPFPQNSLLAARVATVGRDETWVEDFCRSVFRAEFGGGKNIAHPATLVAILDGFGVASADVLVAASLPENKDRLRSETEEAMARGVFGAPAFVAIDGELFWGNDRLEAAVDWAADH